MAALSGSFFLAWVLLNLFSPKVEGTKADNPHDQHQRYRLGASDPGNKWGLANILFGATAICVGIVYALPFLCASRILYIQDQSQLEQGCQDSCHDAVETRVISNEPANSQPGSQSCSLQCTEDQRIYAQRLRCMERLLEGFLSNVRSQRQALAGPGG